MCEVLKTNFEEILPTIEDAIKKCSFVAIDLEFTGLQLDEDSRYNLFDSATDRYAKLRRSSQSFTISQIGLATFINDPKTKSYTARVFNFYVFPQNCGSYDARFTCQASSLKFLCEYGFDFNKFIYDGIPYLTQMQEKQLRSLAKDHPDELTSGVRDMFFSPFFCTVSDWLTKAEFDDELVLETTKGVDLLMFQAKLCNMFHEIWTRTNSSNEVIVIKVNENKRRELEDAAPKWTERILDRLLGFSKVFKLISDSKKPLIGHNMLMDLLLMFDKFHNKLPSSWTDFKQELHRILPNIYDTKHLACKSKKILEEHNLHTQTNIVDLFQMLKSEKGRFAVMNSPTISLDSNCNRYDGQHLYHEAGYDAYISGYVFLRLCHLIAVKNMYMGLKPLRFCDYIHVIQPYKNNVNLIRANLMYVNLGGKDPKSQRPEWLYVASRSKHSLPPAGQLASIFADYSAVDVRILDNRTAVLAVTTFMGSKEIVKAFRHNKSFSVTRYNVFQHCKLLRYTLWCSIITMGALCVWTFISDRS